MERSINRVSRLGVYGRDASGRSCGSRQAGTNSRAAIAEGFMNLSLLREPGGIGAIKSKRRMLRYFVGALAVSAAFAAGLPTRPKNNEAYAVLILSRRFHPALGVS